MSKYTPPHSADPAAGPPQGSSAVAVAARPLAEREPNDMPPTSGDVQSPLSGGRKLGVAGAVTLAVLGAGHAVGGEWAQVAGGALEVLPPLLLAVLAYAGVRRPWARGLAVTALACILLTVALGAVALTLASLTPHA